MTTVVPREIGIALAFFAIPLWAFGIHWEAFVAGAALVALDAYMAHRRGQRAREAMGLGRGFTPIFETIWESKAGGRGSTGGDPNVRAQEQPM